MKAFTVDNSYTRLPETFFRRVIPTPVAEPQWLSFNSQLAIQLGLPEKYHQTDEGLQVFAGNTIPDWAEPIAQGYAGHQFAHFVAQLGDGRAVLLAEVKDQQGKRRDIQLKGAGTTPYSRGGDGRSPIGPVIREYLISEAMHRLGVPTTRALTAVVTGEPVYRQRAEPGAILTRVANSHIRVGTFQFIAAHQGPEQVRVLADYVIDRHYPAARSEPNRYLALLREVGQKQAELIAHWMGLGFIHGVMNTDNTSISGETIDYGPCAFMDNYHPDTVFSSIDRHGRYAYSKQPMIAQWNLARLAECVLPLVDKDEKQAEELAIEVLKAFKPAYQSAWRKRFGAKLGLAHVAEEDDALINDLLDLMAANEIDFTLFFRALCNATENDSAVIDFFENPANWQSWAREWRERLGKNGQSLQAIAKSMREVNPAVIPRNHRVQQAIAAAENDGDLRPFNELKAALADPFSDNPEYSHLTEPPKDDEKVERTFCGT